MIDRKQQLQTEAGTRRKMLDDTKAELARATARFKATRHPGDGDRVADLAGRLRLAEIALDGVLEEIANADAPRPVELTSSREDLIRRREQITARRDWRHKQHAEAVEQERQRCGYRIEHHLEVHLKNVFGPGERQRRQADEQDARELQSIADQLAELDRRESATPKPLMPPMATPAQAAP